MRFQTQSYLSADVRNQVIERLNRTLADTTVLMTHAKFAHWNVKGMSFHGLHELFDDIAEMLEDHVDTVAERITALGGQAMGTAGMAVTNSRIPAMQRDLVIGREYVQALAERVAVHDANLAQDMAVVNELNDLDTADLLNEVSRDVSKALWFLEAHLQTEPVSSGGTQTQTMATGTGTQSQQTGRHQFGTNQTQPQSGQGYQAQSQTQFASPTQQ